MRTYVDNPPRRLKEVFIYALIVGLAVGVIFALQFYEAPYQPCPAEDMVKVPVNYPEGPDKCVHDGR